MTYKRLLPSIVATLALLFSMSSLSAQYDDIYYNPDQDYDATSTTYDSDYSEPTNSAYDDEFYDDGGERYATRNADYEDEYHDYYYSSRIRRFRRPYTGFNYYDPVYVDVNYYDPFFQPGANTVLIYNSYGPASYFRARRFNNWNRNNRFGAFDAWGRPVYGFNSFGNNWNNGFGNRFGNNWNNGFGNNFNNGFGNNGFGNNFGNTGGYYCPPSWGGGNTYVNNTTVINNNRPNRAVVNAPRSGTTSIARRIERQPRNVGNTSRDVRPNNRAVAPSSSRTSRATTPNSSRSSRTAPSGTTPSSSSRIDRNRTTVRPSSSRTRATTPSTTRPSSSSRSTTRPSTSTRRSSGGGSYSPNRSSSSSRSASPSRSSSSSRSASPSRSSSSSRSASPSRSSSSSRSSSGRGGRGGK